MSDISYESNRHAFSLNSNFEHLKVELRPLEGPNGRVIEDLFYVWMFGNMLIICSIKIVDQNMLRTSTT